MQKILIVEDDPIQLEMLYETVHSRYPAWEIKKGSSLEAAQAFLQESVTANEYFTLFLLDIQLSKEPGDRNGRHFCLRQRAARARPGGFCLRGGGNRGRERRGVPARRP